MPLSFVQSITSARSWEKLPILLLVSEVGEEEEESCFTPSLLSGRQMQQSCRNMLCLIMLMRSLCWAMLSPLPHAEGTVPAAEAPLLPWVPCASVLQQQTQASSLLSTFPFIIWLSLIYVPC